MEQSDGPSVVAGEDGPSAKDVVLIVEDHAMIAQAMAIGLTTAGYVPHIASLDGNDPVVEQAVRLRPTLVLLDLGLDGADGLDLIAGLRSAGARVLLVTAESDESRIAAGIARGACGWVSKAEPFEQLLRAVRLALHDRPLLDRVGYDEAVQEGRAWWESHREVRARAAALTEREWEVLQAIRDGESAQDIARDWVLSVGTIRSHIRSILVKLDVTSQVAAVAQVRGLVPPRQDRAAERWRRWRRRYWAGTQS